MGLLDEAIKEHLELKRRRGADPNDLAREEREALGPAVREVREAMTGEEGAAVADDAAPAEADGAGVAPEAQLDQAPPAEEPAPAPTEQAEQAHDQPPDQATQVFDAEDLFAEEDRAPVPDPEAPAPGEPRPAADPDTVAEDPEAPQPPANALRRRNNVCSLTPSRS